MMANSIELAVNEVRFLHRFKTKSVFGKVDSWRQTFRSAEVVENILDT